MTKEKRALTAKDITKLAVYSDPQHTPNGDTYAFVSTTINEDNKYQSQVGS